ncbi:MAG: SoxR reducing system RseC family protein [Bacteroidales bacterium]|jgi:sigma-E factor negative regulatory protein RseC|nr:SoxR reducing system RseC family protein [Bacteroidales bacterium]
MKEIIHHTGKVIAVLPNEVRVEVERGDACASCTNKTSCMFGNTTTQIIPIKTPFASSFSEGEAVVVSMETSSGLKAVWYAYLIPFILLVASFVVFRCLFRSEPLQILLTLLFVAVYYFILYKTKNRMDKKFRFFVSKL